MNRISWCSGLAAVILLTGCGAVEEAQKAAEKAAADVKASAQDASQKTKAAVEGAVADVASLKVGDIDLGKDLGSLLTGLQSTLGEVKDEATAKTALPKLEEANLGLDKLLGLVDQIPAAARPALASLLKTHSTAITDAVKKVVGIEGVGAILQPVLDQIVAKLNKASAA
jgi:hypothetical protein